MIFQQVVAIQHDIYLALAQQIKLLAAGGGWLAFLSFLPMGILFGAVHALTPGHSKRCWPRISPDRKQGSRAVCLPRWCSPSRT